MINIKKILYYVLVLVLLMIIIVQFQLNKNTNSGLIKHDEDLDNVVDKIDNINNRLDILSDRLLTVEDMSALNEQLDDIANRLTDIEQDWLRLFGPIPIPDGADELAMPTEPNDDRYTDDDNYSGFYGRLYIPDAEIDVAIYRGIHQYITDRADSANLFTWKNYTGLAIADHCTQEFAKLFSVDVGTTGFIRCKDGEIINIKCVKVIDGYNAGYDGITDKSGRCVMSDSTYIMYTCRNGWQNIRIWFWVIY